jgi:23S rRNA (cytosine1962-C5)-methyltransferase
MTMPPPSHPGSIPAPQFLELLSGALAARRRLFDADHLRAFRLFNGFTEGCPQVVIDLYGNTAVLNNYADPPGEGQPLIDAAQTYLQEQLPWLDAIVLKSRSAPSIEERNGRLIWGSHPAEKIREQRVWYAVNLTLGQDATLHLDTRHLRRWAMEHLPRKTMLNAFAYTGSLGVAAKAGEASRVVHLDRNPRFLDVAKASYRLNGYPVHAADFVEADFFRQTATFRRRDQRFDCVVLDPPFFSASTSGVVDQIHASSRLIHKVKPLVAQGGYLVAINNALFVSGAACMETLQAVCSDGYMEIVELIPVPEDFAGYLETRRGAPVTDPAPFNHSTKIAALRSTAPT